MKLKLRKTLNNASVNVRMQNHLLINLQQKANNSVRIPVVNNMLILFQVTDTV